MVTVEFSRENVIEILRKTGYGDFADEARRDLPEQFDRAELEAWAEPRGITLDELISRMGGSP